MSIFDNTCLLNEDCRKFKFQKRNKSFDEKCLRERIVDCMSGFPKAEYILVHVNKRNPKYIADSRTMSIDEMIDATRNLPVFQISSSTFMNDENGVHHCDIEICTY